MERDLGNPHQFSTTGRIGGSNPHVQHLHIFTKEAIVVLPVGRKQMIIKNLKKKKLFIILHYVSYYVVVEFI